MLGRGAACGWLSVVRSLSLLRVVGKHRPKTLGTLEGCVGLQEGSLAVLA